MYASSRRDAGQVDDGDDGVLPIATDRGPQCRRGTGSRRPAEQVGRLDKSPWKLPMSICEVLGPWHAVTPTPIPTPRRCGGRSRRDDSVGVAEVEHLAGRLGHGAAAIIASTTSSTYRQSRRCEPSPYSVMSSPSRARLMNTAGSPDRGGRDATAGRRRWSVATPTFACRTRVRRADGAARRRACRCR